MVQENLKKAFMRGVCALNYEAMSILSPSDANYQSQVEREMENQVISAMNGIANNTSSSAQSDYQKSPSVTSS